MDQAIEDFIVRITHEDEDDYGDWMRRANLYWWDLVERLYVICLAPPRVVRRGLVQMHELFQYTPDFQRVETERAVVEIALRIRKSLGATHDLDPHVFDVSMTEATPVGEPAFISEH
jgi:hypothetical protein